jgi:hypothetical protein
VHESTKVAALKRIKWKYLFAFLFLDLVAWRVFSMATNILIEMIIPLFFFSG